MGENGVRRVLVFVFGFFLFQISFCHLAVSGSLANVTVAKLTKAQIDKLWRTIGRKPADRSVQTAQVIEESGQKEEEIISSSPRERKGFFKKFELHGEERFSLYHDRVSGNKQNAQIEEGPQFLQELDLSLARHGKNGREFEMVFNSRLTDDQYVDTEHASIVDFHLTESGKSFVVTLGDFLGTLTDFTFNQALRGGYVEKSFSSLKDLKVIALAGVLNDRWEAFWKNLEDESYARYFEGGRISFKPLAPLTLGFNFVNASDDPGSVQGSSMPSLENRLGSMDFSLGLLDNALTFGGEAAWSWYEAHPEDGDTPSSEQGSMTDAAYRLTGSFQKEKYSLNAGYSRMEPDFRSLGGISSPDTEEYYATLDYAPVDQVSLQLSYHASRDNLDGQLETTTRNKMPELQITFQEIPHLKDLVLMFKLNRTMADSSDDTTNETTDTGDVEIDYTLFKLHIVATGEIRYKTDDADRMNSIRTHSFGVHLDRAFERGKFYFSPYVGFDWERQKGNAMASQTMIDVEGTEQLEVSMQDFAPRVLETLRFTRTYSAGFQASAGKDWDMDFKYQFIDEDVNAAGGGDNSSTTTVDASLNYRLFGSENNLLTFYYKLNDYNFEVHGDDYTEEVLGMRVTKKF